MLLSSLTAWAAAAGGRAGGHWRGDALRAARAAFVRHDAVSLSKSIQSQYGCLLPHPSYLPERHTDFAISSLPPPSIFQERPVLLCVQINILETQDQPIAGQDCEFGDGREHCLDDKNTHLCLEHLNDKSTELCLSTTSMG